MVNFFCFLTAFVLGWVAYNLALIAWNLLKKG